MLFSNSRTCGTPNRFGDGKHSRCNFWDIDNIPEATNFAAASLALFSHCIIILSSSVDDWAKCLIADNASLSLKVAKLCTKPQVNFVSHKLT